MSTTCLRIFMSEASRHQGKLTYEWLLATAQSMGIGAATAFHALAGYGRHGRHDAGFFELAGEQAVVVEFLVEDEMADQLLQAISVAGLKLVYARLPAQLGVTG